MANFTALSRPTRALMRTANFDPEVNNGIVNPSEITYYFTLGSLMWIVAFLLAMTLSVDIYLIAGPQFSEAGRFFAIAGLVAVFIPVTWTIERSLICSLPHVLNGPSKTRALALRGLITMGSATLSTLTLLLFANGPELDLRNQQAHLSRIEHSRDQVTKGSGLEAANLAIDQSQREAARLTQLLNGDAPTAGLAAMLQASDTCREQLAQLQQTLDPRIATWAAERRLLNPQDSRHVDLSQELAQARQQISSKRFQCQQATKTYVAAKGEHERGVKRSLEAVNAQVTQQRSQQQKTQASVDTEMAVLSSRSAAVAMPRLSSRADALFGLLQDSLGVALVSLCWFFVIVGFEMAAIVHKLSKTTVHQVQAQQRDELTSTAAIEETTRSQAHQRAIRDFWQSEAGKTVAEQRVASREHEVQLTEKMQRRARVTGVAARAYINSLNDTEPQSFDNPEVREAAAQLRRDLSEMKGNADRPKTPTPKANA